MCLNHYICSFKKEIFLSILLLIVNISLFAKWTIFVYMAADNDLHEYAIDDIIKMQKGLVDNKEKVEIIVYIDHIDDYKNGRVEYLRITAGNNDFITSAVLQSYPDEDSGNPATLTKFINWAFPRYSAEKNVLVLWSHSNGWTRGNGQKWICGDNTAGSSIGVSNGELHQSLKKTSRKYDIIILDACYTGSIEFISEIKDFTSYIIASPEEFPAIGFPWTEILRNWQTSASAK
jgi:hypothetical protein